MAAESGLNRPPQVVFHSAAGHEARLAGGAVAAVDASSVLRPSVPMRCFITSSVMCLACLLVLRSRRRQPEKYQRFCRPRCIWCSDRQVSPWSLRGIGGAVAVQPKKVGCYFVSLSHYCAADLFRIQCYSYWRIQCYSHWRIQQKSCLCPQGPKLTSCPLTLNWHSEKKLRLFPQRAFCNLTCTFGAAGKLSFRSHSVDSATLTTTPGSLAPTSTRQIAFWSSSKLATGSVGNCSFPELSFVHNAFARCICYLSKSPSPTIARCFACWAPEFFF